MRDIGGLVALAAQGDGSEVGAVRLDEEFVCRSLAYDVGQLRRVLVRERPVDADAEAHLPQFACHLETARVAVEDACEPRTLGAQHGKRVAVCLAVMNADGKPRLACEVKLRCKEVTLQGAA